MTVRIINSDVLEGLAQLEDESVQCCVTSPPYWGLRDYGVEGQIGLEPTPDAFVAKMVEVFREVRRVLRKDGVLFMNLGDSYAGSWGAQGRQGETGQMSGRSVASARQIAVAQRHESKTGSLEKTPGLKPKDLVGIPWMTAFALRADGWYLRQEIIWAKPNPMPESIRDRCTKAHEHIFLLSRSGRYWFDQDAIRTPFSGETKAQSFETMDYKARDRYKKPDGWDTGKGGHGAIHRNGREKGELAPVDYVPPAGANKRSVWTISTAPYTDAHFATFPEELPEICIKAGSKPGDMILDPFGGAGTTGLVADKLGRNAVLIELNPEYAAMAEKRITGNCPMFASVSVEGAAA